MLLCLKYIYDDIATFVLCSIRIKLTKLNSSVTDADNVFNILKDSYEGSELREEAPAHLQRVRWEAHQDSADDGSFTRSSPLKYERLVII
jgi:ActR/RegA family two-component response regulator